MRCHCVGGYSSNVRTRCSGIWFCRYSGMYVGNLRAFGLLNQETNTKVANAGVGEIGGRMMHDPRSGRPTKPLVTTIDVNLTGVLYSESPVILSVCLLMWLTSDPNHRQRSILRSITLRLVDPKTRLL